MPRNEDLLKSLENAVSSPVQDKKLEASDLQASLEKAEAEKREAPVHVEVLPKAEEPAKVEEPKAEEPAKVEPPKPEEPAKAEEPKPEAPAKVEEPKAEEPAVAEPEPEVPAVAEEPVKPAKKEDAAGNSIFKICMPLTVICLVVALMLAVVNLVTVDKIAENSAKEKAEAVQILYPGAEIEEYETRDGATVYAVLQDNTLLGACVSLASNGFGGAIDMMVGLNPDNSVRGVRIISMSETPGIGSKTKNDDFLARYAGRSGTLTVGENFDGISGASISSRAVTAGVNSALGLNLDFAAMAQQYGLEIADIPEAQQEQEAEKVAAAEKPQQVLEAPQTAAETEKVVPVETAAPAVAETERIPVERTIPVLTLSAKKGGVSKVARVAGETVHEQETAEDGSVATQPPATTKAPTTTKATTKAPANTKAPSTTKAPANTKAPATTKAPVTAKPVPAETQAPAPVETEAPAPVETETPAPAETSAPVKPAQPAEEEDDSGDEWRGWDGWDYVEDEEEYINPITGKPFH